MIGRIDSVDNLEPTVETLCDPSIQVVNALLLKDSLTELEVAELDRNVRHLELFDYAPANDAILAGRAELEKYSG